MNWSLLVTYIIAECFIPYWICIVLHLFSLCLLDTGSRNTDQDIGIRLSHHVLFLQILMKIWVIRYIDFGYIRLYLGLNHIQNNFVWWRVKLNTILNPSNIGWRFLLFFIWWSWNASCSRCRFLWWLCNGLKVSEFLNTSREVHLPKRNDNFSKRVIFGHHIIIKHSQSQIKIWKIVNANLYLKK